MAQLHIVNSFTWLELNLKSPTARQDFGRVIFWARQNDWCRKVLNVGDYKIRVCKLEDGHSGICGYMHDYYAEQGLSSLERLFGQ